MGDYKLWITLAAAVLLLAVGGAFFVSCRGPSFEIKQLSYFSFSYTSGYSAYSSANYSLTLENGVYTASIKPLNEPDENERRFTVDHAFAERLAELLRTNGVESWNGFNKSNKHVMDGNSFSLTLKNLDGEVLSALGYMSWPKNYSETKAAIIELFSEQESAS